ncbi:MAG: alpha-isopropylmalate synthase regulatory domain-containing protein, partial [Pseudomonadota bacterium]
HQDAIKKGMEFRDAANTQYWEVPYLPIDPADVGRTYGAVIRVNSQSGKGGVAYLLKAKKGFDLPKRLQIEFSPIIQKHADDSGKELTADDIYAAFHDAYLAEGRLAYLDHETTKIARGSPVVRLRGLVRRDGVETAIEGEGNGPVAALVHALDVLDGVKIEVLDYASHALSSGEDASAASYVEARIDGGPPLWGVGVAESTTVANLKAVIGAVNRGRGG